MELSEALGRISEIRAQLERTETFHGYRSVTVAFSGVLGIAAAVVQREQGLRPNDHVWQFVDLWASVAAISVLVVGTEMAYRCSVAGSPLKRRLTLLAIQQFVPCLFTGAVVTGVIPTFAPECAWMLPGLWALLFSLGVFASCRLLPRATFWIGVYYLAAGTVCLAMGRSAQSLSPWMMMATFGIGQLLAAGILYVTLERPHAQAEE